jgi:hypothetical protein
MTFEEKVVNAWLEANKGSPLKDFLTDREIFEAIDILVGQWLARSLTKCEKPIGYLSPCHGDDNEQIGYTFWDKDVGKGCFPVYTTLPKIKKRNT